MAGTKSLLEWADSRIVCILYVDRVKVGYIVNGSDNEWVAYAEMGSIARRIGQSSDKLVAKNLLEIYVKETRNASS